MFHRTHTNTDGYYETVPTAEWEPLKGGSSGSSGFSKALFLVVNSVLGAGILSLSYAVRTSGIVPFILLLAGTGLMAHFTITLLLDCCVLADTTTYEDIGYASYGYSGRLIAAICIWIQNISQMTSYMVIVGDLVPDIVSFLAPHSSWSNRTLLMCLIVGSIVFPLSVLKRISFLAYSSVFSISCSLLFMGVVIAKQSSIPCPLPGLPGPFTGYCEVKFFNISIDTAFAVPTIIFSFVCHPTVLPVYSELRDRSRRLMGRVSMVGMAMCVVVYLLVALFGYLTFRGAVLGDLLKMYSLLYKMGSRYVVLVTQIAIASSVLFIIPLIHYSTRKAVEVVVFGSRPFSWLRHVCEAIVLLGISLTIAIIVQDLDTVLAVSGATSGFSVFSILPCIFYLRLSTKLEVTKRGWWTLRRSLAVFVLVLSVCLAVFNVYGVVSSLIGQAM